jgi:hypothetical protein
MDTVEGNVKVRDAIGVCCARGLVENELILVSCAS